MTLTKVAEDKIRLADLHGSCELNYARLMQLCPDLRILPHRELQAGKGNQFGLYLEVTERSPYTTMVKLNLSIAGIPWAGMQNLALRVYHDARMLEVVSCETSRIVAIRNAYPNMEMHLPDEKLQLNHFLGVWLDYFLAHGREKGSRASQALVS